MVSLNDEDSVLSYSIHSWSSFSGDFSPDNILTDSPSDPKSRWLSCDNRIPQFLTLKLEQPAIVRSIMFGKFDKSHPCNLRKFGVYGGMDPNHLHLLLENGLSNDDHPETFDLQSHMKQDMLPCQYIKITPIQSWGYSFNFSIWYVKLKGTTDKACVDQAVKIFKDYCDREAVRVCLKHLREHDYTEAFDALQKKAKVSLEHPLLTQLHNLLVMKGDFEAAEKLIGQAAEDGYLDGYISEQPIDAQWTQLHPTLQTTASSSDDLTASPTPHRDGPVTPEAPGGRGGHQMCLDPSSQMIYLHGGWDGSKDLADLWRYDIRRRLWTCLFQDTSMAGGPSPRSCHKMCIDIQSKTLYLLGQYLDHPARSLMDLSSVLLGDFYSYSISESTWSLISSDTYSDGGPKLIFDHQICFDQNTGALYVFGGRILSNQFLGGDSTAYSGLYAYHVTDKQWVCLRPDLTSQYKHSLKPRMAHSMILDSVNHLLYVLGGQRDKEPLSDMVMYDLLSDTTTVIADGDTTQIPASGFTVRTTLNTDKSEICLFASLSKFDKMEDRERRQVSKTCSNSLWIYELTTEKWKCIFQGDQAASQSSASIGTIPIPRYAHQFVYDSNQDTYYMFGGNPGGGTSAKSFPVSMRLDDFWQLKFISQTKDELLRHCRYIIRKQKFAELAVSSPVEAISYLQMELAALVNHDNKEESAEFRELTSVLFVSSANATQKVPSFCPDRNKLYSELSSYFPKHMTQPKENIADLIKL